MEDRSITLLRQVLPAGWDMPPAPAERWLLIAILATAAGDARMKEAALQALRKLQR
ncbi:MAG TPA: hypothetical protein GXX28_09145 [Firmicutes bacterium]|nr:hypothetical protein [Bacillota bacterium]